MQANAEAGQEKKRVIQAARNIARMQNGQPACGLQIAEASGSVLNVGLQMINGVLILHAALDGERRQLARDSFTALLYEGPEFLIKCLEEGGVARQLAAVQKTDGELAVLLVFDDALGDGVDRMAGTESEIPKGLEKNR